MTGARTIPDALANGATVAGLKTLTDLN